MNSTSGSGGAARFFYPVSAFLMAALTAAGFIQFYAHGMAYPGREIAPPIKTLVMVHGISMTAWILLLVVQSLLILKRNFRLHMALGMAGALLAIAILALGIPLSIQSTRLIPPEARLYSLTPGEFMAVPFFSILLFAILVAVGIGNRRKPEIHKPMMLLATLAAVSAAVARIDVLNGLTAGTVLEQQFGPFFMASVIAAVLVVLRCILIRGVDRVLTSGVGALILANWLIIAFAKTEAWDSFVKMCMNQ